MLTEYQGFSKSQILAIEDLRMSLAQVPAPRVALLFLLFFLCLLPLYDSHRREPGYLSGDAGTTNHIDDPIDVFVGCRCFFG
jgi:hypothetical protein